MVSRPRGARRKPQPSSPRNSLRQRVTLALPWVLASLILCVVLGAMIYLPRALDNYPIETVKVEGVVDDRRQQEVQIILSALVRDENFFSLSLADVYRQVRTLEWVSEARVRRQWPDNLVVRIDERVPVAVWNGELLVSNSGEPFRALNKYTVGKLPQLNGPAERLTSVMDYYHSMSKVLAPAGRRIQRLEVDARLTARLQLDNGVRVIVDREQYARKLRRFVNLYERILSGDSRDLAQVDLRYADGLAVQWRQATPQSGNKRS